MDDGVKAQPLLKKNKSYGDLQTGGISQKETKPSCVNEATTNMRKGGSKFFPPIRRLYPSFIQETRSRETLEV